MEVTALCVTLMVNVLSLLTAGGQSSDYVQRSDASSLQVDPDRLQFFEYDSISLKCSSEWRVMRKVSSNVSQWETSPGLFNIMPAFKSDSGEYWCENGEGDRSNAVNITVTAGDVILESPALPVMERQTVTLRCRRKMTSSNSAADFYKDGRFSKTGYTGDMTIQNVSWSSEGLYRCEISGAGGSPESWLAVRAYTAPAPEDTTPQEGHESSPHPPYPGSIQLFILLPVVFSILCVAVLVLVVGILRCRKHRGGQEATVVNDTADVTYAVVTKERASREADAPDLQLTETYANVTREERDC